MQTSKAPNATSAASTLRPYVATPGFVNIQKIPTERTKIDVAILSSLTVPYVRRGAKRNKPEAAQPTKAPKKT